MHGSAMKRNSRYENFAPLQTSFVVYAISPAAYDFVICGFNAVVKFREKAPTVPLI